MRKFLIEMDTEITLAELRKGYESGEFETDAETFEQYLEQCMARNNGALTEIVTADTPKEELRTAVTLCHMKDMETGDEWEEWLTLDEWNYKKWCGYWVTPIY